MAGRGPAPKEPARRRRRNADAAPLVTLEPDDELRGPELPEGVLGEDDGEPVDWHPMTKLWWESWRTSAQAALFTATDWLFLIDTALMHHTMWAKGRWEFASEVRLRAAKFGATPEDRMRLKIQVETPGSSRPAVSTALAGVTDIASRRSRLTA
ncbi:phage terminase small subunit [Kitasatospora purpeofusca]|uniref:phage terminase small subunit n=1 Tax=Kitasatospora purpeofusca TaxID=67352 RepID=UPI0036BEC8D3